MMSLLVTVDEFEMVAFLWYVILCNVNLSSDMAISLLFGLIVPSTPTFMGNVGWSMLSFSFLASVAAET